MVTGGGAFSGAINAGGTITANTDFISSQAPVRVYANNGSNLIFRGIVATAHADNATGTYFQIGVAGGNTIITAANSGVASRFTTITSGFQVSAAASTSTPVPTRLFEVINNTPAVVFSVSASGVVTTASDINVTGHIRFNGTNSTGSGSASLGSNCPAIDPSTPYVWIRGTAADGSIIWSPWFK